VVLGRIGLAPLKLCCTRRTLTPSAAAMAAVDCPCISRAKICRVRALLATGLRMGGVLASDMAGLLKGTRVLYLYL
jgi:hypothetical protein